MDNLAPLYQQIAAAGQQLDAGQVVLYGSRARGDFHERSDVDIAVFDMPEDNRAQFWMELEELPTLLKFDIVHFPPYGDTKFLDNIKRDGVILYAKS